MLAGVPLDCPAIPDNAGLFSPCCERPQLPARGAVVAFAVACLRSDICDGGAVDLGPGRPHQSDLPSYHTMILAKSSWACCACPVKRACGRPLGSNSSETSRTFSSSQPSFLSRLNSGFSPSSSTPIRRRPCRYPSNITFRFDRRPSGLRLPNNLQLVARRRYSSTSAAFTAGPSGASTASSSSSSMAMMAPFISELDRIAPAVDLDASQITILETPAEFYDTIKSRIRTARRRIFLSTLYIGRAEEELVSRRVAASTLKRSCAVQCSACPLTTRAICPSLVVDDPRSAAHKPLGKALCPDGYASGHSGGAEAVVRVLDGATGGRVWRAEGRDSHVPHTEPDGNEEAPRSKTD